MSESPELRLLHDISHFLHSPRVESLLLIHPNQLCQSSSFVVPSLWHSWWTWAGEPEKTKICPLHELQSLAEPKWLHLLRYYVFPEHEAVGVDDAHLCIPKELRELVDDARRLQITRQPGPVLPASATPSGLSDHTHSPVQFEPAEPFLSSGRSGDAFGGSVQSSSWSRGMSPKKAHEVHCMTEYTSRLLSIPSLRDVRHVVDVGAGQAYLSRKLRDDLGLHVLALDWSDVQSKGAARKDIPNGKEDRNARSRTVKSPSAGPPDAKVDAQTVQPQGSLTYKTVQITPSSLVDAVDDWIRDGVGTSNPAFLCPETSVPLLFVALHACSSLTPSVLRVLVSRMKSTDRTQNWTPRAAVVVGCCYNLLDPIDFPLSHALSRSSSSLDAVALTPNHMQLAAQVPAQWLRSEGSLNMAKLAMRKVAWRALLEDMLDQRGARNTGESEDSADVPTTVPGPATDRQESWRLGRLNDSAYIDWTTFLARAGPKFGVDRTGRGLPKDGAMESRLEVFHVLRCILGPVIESLIVLDRQQWLVEQLENAMMDTQLVNLFDQDSGSARNVAIAFVPHLSLPISWP